MWSVDGLLDAEKRSERPRATLTSEFHNRPAADLS
jgi:hypothetical protein